VRGGASFDVVPEVSLAKRLHLGRRYLASGSSVLLHAPEEPREVLHARTERERQRSTTRQIEIDHPRDRRGSVGSLPHEQVLQVQVRMHDTGVVHAPHGGRGGAGGRDALGVADGGREEVQQIAGARPIGVRVGPL